MSNPNRKFREVTWDDVRLEVKGLAPDLFETIEAISPDNTYKLYEACYRYGDKIVDDQGYFSLPIEGKLIPIGSSEIGNKINEQLSTNFPGIQLGLVLQGKMQLSFEEKNHLSMPASIFARGDIFSVNTALDYPARYQVPAYWRMFSGLRTVYLIPSIANRLNFMRIQEQFGADITMPEHQTDHWQFFRDLVNSQNFETTWHTRLLFFGKKWIEMLQENEKFRLILLNRTWKSTALLRNSFVFDEIWEEFIETIRNKKVDRYVLNMARYVFEASIGKAYSFQVADADDSAGPFTEIAQVLRDVYRLKKYAPIFMAPELYNPEKQNQAYVSIQLPTVNVLREYTSKNNFLMADFREIYYVVNKFLTSPNMEILNKQTPLYDMHRFNYEFYSADKDRMGNFLDAQDLFKNELKMQKWIGLGEKNIDTKNTFMRACVKIGHK